MSARILVVDDVDINVKLLGAKLASEYFDVLTAGGGAAALAVCAAQLPDLVLLDVMMPEMDGFEVYRQLKADSATAHVPVAIDRVVRRAGSRARSRSRRRRCLTKPVHDAAPRRASARCCGSRWRATSSACARRRRRASASTTAAPARARSTAQRHDRGGRRQPRDGGGARARDRRSQVVAAFARRRSTRALPSAATSCHRQSRPSQDDALQRCAARGRATRRCRSWCWCRTARRTAWSRRSTSIATTR